MSTLLDISMSLDGFVAGPNVSIQSPMGDGGEALHRWLFDAKTPVDEAIAAELLGSLGAVIMGRRTYDVGEAPWGQEPPLPVPCFVLTHRGRAPIVKKDVVTTFMEGGVDAALQAAREAAGDKKVLIMGGAATARQYMRAGLIDELTIHLAHCLLGGGDRLFDAGDVMPLHKIEGADSAAATHLKFRVIREKS
jgi:dihydrofolate reductase